MPRGDGTGPDGQGPLGRGQGGRGRGGGGGGNRQGNRGGGGACRRGFGQGRGGIQGRQGFTAASTRAPQVSDTVTEASASDLETLKGEAQVCAQTLERINTRIAALEAQPPPLSRPNRPDR